MTRNLDELKEKLYDAFDKAITRSEAYYNNDNQKNESAKAAAKLAKAIALVETKLDERDQDKNGIRLPGKG